MCQIQTIKLSGHFHVSEDASDVIMLCDEIERLVCGLRDQQYKAPVILQNLGDQKPQSWFIFNHEYCWIWLRIRGKRSHVYPVRRRRI